MGEHEKRVYDYIVKNVKLDKCGPVISTPYWVKFSDGCKLPFSDLPDDIMANLKRVPNENVYVIV